MSQTGSLRYANTETSKVPVHIEYFDANSLYAWTMMKMLPVGNFRFIPVISFWMSGV